MQIQRYLNRLSGPLLDRIDIQVEVPPVRIQDIEQSEPGEDSATIRKRVNAARHIQKKRFAASPTIHCNAQMGAKQIKEHCPLGSDAKVLVHQAIDRLGLSARAYTRVLKIARTIADLHGAANITSAHVGEAIQYRRMRYQSE